MKKTFYCHMVDGADNVKRKALQVTKKFITDTIGPIKSSWFMPDMVHDDLRTFLFFIDSQNCKDFFGILEECNIQPDLIILDSEFYEFNHFYLTSPIVMDYIINPETRHLLFLAETTRFYKFYEKYKHLIVSDTIPESPDKIDAWEEMLKSNQDNN